MKRLIAVLPIAGAIALALAIVAWPPARPQAPVVRPNVHPKPPIPTLSITSTSAPAPVSAPTATPTSSSSSASTATLAPTASPTRSRTPSAPSSSAPVASTSPIFYVQGDPLWTFDDCEVRPDQGITRQYVDVLKKHGIARATFFLTGRCYRSRPDLVRLIVDAGYSIGNHTLDHSDLTTLAVPAVDVQIEQGPPGTVDFRPPYGAHNATTDARVRQHGERVVMWSASGGDSGAGVTRTCDRILEDLVHTIRSGRIVLLHLFNPNSPAAMDAYLSGKTHCRD